jgi:small subunit ribosomal protein S17
MPRRRLRGTVVSDKMDKTAVVRVETLKPHPLYHKIVRRHKRYKAHDEANEAQVGDVVVIEECRPLSRDKTWTIVEWLEKGARA